MLDCKHYEAETARLTKALKAIREEWGGNQKPVA